MTKNLSAVEYVNPYFDAENDPEFESDIKSVVCPKRVNKQPWIVFGDGTIQSIPRHEAAAILWNYHAAYIEYYGGVKGHVCMGLPPGTFADKKLIRCGHFITEKQAHDSPQPKFVKGGRVHVIPLKNGCWRTVVMSPAREKWWERVWMTWYQAKGIRLAHSPEMWIE